MEALQKTVNEMKEKFPESFKLMDKMTLSKRNAFKAVKLCTVLLMTTILENT